MERQTDRRNCYYQYRPLHFDAESCFKNIMHLRGRECVRTLRPLFVYATDLVYDRVVILLLECFSWKLLTFVSLRPILACVYHFLTVCICFLLLPYL